MQEKITDEHPLKGILILVNLILPALVVVKTTTFTFTGNHEILETTILLPWIILLHYQPSWYFHSEMYQMIGIPIAVLIFLPTWTALLIMMKRIFTKFEIYEIKYCLFLYIVQFFLIITLNLSQSKDATEVIEYRRYYLLPQLFMIFILGFLWITYVTSDSNLSEIDAQM